MAISPLTNVTRHFLGWERPLLPAAVAWLGEGWAGAEPLDLSRLLVVVPTRQAGRRLRSGLAAWAAERGQAVFSPRVVLPDELITPPDAAGVASALQVDLTWAHLLVGLPLGEFRAVFPVDPPAQDLAWALRLGARLAQLQRELGEAGWALDEVASRVPTDSGERERWEQLGALGRMHAAALRQQGWQAPAAARRDAAAAPVVPAGVERIIVLATPDPAPLALRALMHLSVSYPVTVAIAAPEDEAESFDGWGCPVEEAWAKREPAWGDFGGQVHLLADVVAQAEAMAKLTRSYGAPDGVVALAMADAELGPVVESALARAGRVAFNPAGELQRAHGFYHFLAAVAALAREPGFTQVLALARSPEALAWLQAELGGDFQVERWLGQLDEIHAKHLPATLADARRHARVPMVAEGLGRMAELVGALREGGFAEGVERVLGRVLASRRVEWSRADDRKWAEGVEAWMAEVAECAELSECFPEVTRGEWWEIALGRFGEQRREAEKPAGALELQGWLELPYEDAPHVVVAGFNDGCVPEAVVGDVFLPENLRVALGLRNNAARFARDAYLLTALVASRRGVGRVDVLLGKVSAGGEPRRPSRLLLQCADAALPERIGHLFRSLEAPAALPAWERAWRLTPRRGAAPSRLAPTAFRSYLECPFRFYLKHVLRMEGFDAAKREMDASDFGSLCHGPLEKFAEVPWRDCTDERLLAAMLIEELEHVARERFGDALTVPLVAQLESARQRLRWAAKVQAQQRTEGWVVQAVERKFDFELGGLRITGRIDRIDRHERTGVWRVVDYKTSDRAKSPIEAHLTAAREGAPEWARLLVDGREKRWTDLQLPLYVQALPTVLPEATGRAACGYFNLPKAASATALTEWEGYSVELHESALRCAEAVIAAVRAGQFWPPNEEISGREDTYAMLFHRGVAASVAEEGRP